jgi:hypothetical protein
MDTKEKTEFESQRNGAMIFGALVYVGVAVATTTLFVTFILTAFPEDAYFTKFVMTIAGLLVGASMVAFPIALHTWAVGGNHRKVTVALYYIEMFIVAINSIVSFSALLAQYKGYILPEWIALYEPFSVVSIVYTLAAWGTVFILDPSAKAKENLRVAAQKFESKVSEKELEFLDSIEGEEAIIRAATAKINEKYKKDFTGTPRHFGKPQVMNGFASETEQVQQKQDFTPRQSQ